MDTFGPDSSKNIFRHNVLYLPPSLQLRIKQEGNNDFVITSIEFKYLKSLRRHVNSGEPLQLKCCIMYDEDLSPNSTEDYWRIVLFPMTSTSGEPIHHAMIVRTDDSIFDGIIDYKHNPLSPISSNHWEEDTIPEKEVNNILTYIKYLIEDARILDLFN